MHRDFKSSNCLVDKNWNIKLCDFGLTKIKQSIQSAQTFCGTLNHMAPEIMRNTNYNEKVDVYSFGIFLYELIARKKAFAGLSGSQVITTVLAGERPELSSKPDFLKSKLFNAMVELMKDCWQDNPHGRPSSLEVLKRLEKLDPS